MKVLYSARPAFGHLFPLMPLASATRAAGHQVTFATGEGFVPWLGSLGFGARPVGPSMRRAEQSTLEQFPELCALPPHRRWRLTTAMFGEVLPRWVIAEMLPILETERPDLLVYESGDLGAAIAGAIHDVPVVCHAAWALGWPSFMREDMAPRLVGVWHQHQPGQLPIDPFRGALYLDICPTGLRDGAAPAGPGRTPLRPVPWGEPGGGLPAWVREPRTRPLAYLTMGTVPSGAGELLRAAVVGLSRLRLDVIVALGPHDRDVLGVLPDRVHVEQFLRQDLLLPHLDLAVHHGGSGTLMGALAHGVPQLLLPQIADQIPNAHALARSGAGITLPAKTASPETISSAARRLLSEPGYRAAAARLSAEIAAMPAPEQLVATLAGLVEQRNTQALRRDSG